MRNLKFLPAIIGAILAIALILFVAFHFIFLDLFVDLWWFQSLKFESYFWLRLLYKYILSRWRNFGVICHFLFSFLVRIALFWLKSAG